MRNFIVSRVITVALLSTVGLSACTTNYLTNHQTGTYGVPSSERTIAQRLLDQGIEHTAKINIEGLDPNLETTSRIDIDSFFSEVLLTGEVPSEEIKQQITQVISSMPDVKQVYNELTVGTAKSYSYTVHDGYLTSKLVTKIAANNGVKSSQVKVVSNSGMVYVMGRMTPTQQSHLIDIANNTAGITELVLLTTMIDDSGAILGKEDVMQESNLESPYYTAEATPIDANTALALQQANQANAVNTATTTTTNTNSGYVNAPVNTPANVSSNTPYNAPNNVPVNNPSNGNVANGAVTNGATSNSTSPYIQLYQNQNAP